MLPAAPEAISTSQGAVIHPDLHQADSASGSAWHHVIFGSDPKQATNIKRLLMAFASYLLGYAFVFICYQLDLTRFTPLRLTALLLLVCALNGTFYMLIRSGWNRRFADPSLTLLQLYSSLLIIGVGLHYALEARAAMMFFFFFSYMFGLFRLVTRDLLKVGAAALLLYGTIILVAYLQGEAGLDMKLELVQLLALVIVTPWFALMGGSITLLRTRLRTRNEELSKALDKIRMLATHDELTGAYNRRFIMEVLEREVASVGRGNATFCVCLIDLDFFKKINDTFGHAAGDHALACFAEVAQKVMRSQDYFARYGGEEFMLVLVNTQAQAALACAERIRSDVAALPIHYQHQQFSMTISTGVAEYAATEDVKQTIERADRALYRAKNHGRNRTMLANHDDLSAAPGMCKA